MQHLTYRKEGQLTRSHRNEDRGGEHRWTFNGVEYPTRKLMCAARREEYVRLLDEEGVNFTQAAHAVGVSKRTGKRLTARRVEQIVARCLQSAGLSGRGFSPHKLRHTAATLMLQNGVDVKTVSSMLGHYDAGFTLRTYTHATRQKQDEAAQTMGSFMAQVM